MQTAVGKVEALARCPTFSRLENRASRADVIAMNRVLIEQFIASHPRPLEELILDVDASDVPLHGEQELAQFHGYYDHYCYLPLYVFCGQARIVVRGALGFCRQRLLRLCERQGLGYVIGVARNARLHGHVEAWEAELEAGFLRDGTKQRVIREFLYAADSWNVERRIVTRLEYGTQGTNPRFVVTNLDLPATDLYDALYCQRGEAEDRIKEAQLDLFGARASCHKFHANWLRLREIAFQGTELANATAATIRTRLLKIGAAILANTRCVRILLASHHPLRETFLTAARALAP